MSKRNRIKDFAPRVLGGAVALLIATLVGLTFWPDMPEVPAHQPVSTFESQFAVLRTDCLAAGIAALPSDARAAKKAECDKQAYAARQTHRDASQSIRAINASEGGLWLAYQQAQVGIIQAILTVMALLATAWAAWAAADAAQAAERALDHSESMSNREHRAWIEIELVPQFLRVEKGISALTFRANLKNFGKSVATKVRCESRLFYLSPGVKADLSAFFREPFGACPPRVVIPNGEIPVISVNDVSYPDDTDVPLDLILAVRVRYRSSEGATNSNSTFYTFLVKAGATRQNFLKPKPIDFHQWEESIVD